MKIQKQEKQVEVYKPEIYSTEELKSLERNLDENYKITKTLSNGKEVSFYDEEQYLKDVGALNERGAVLMIDNPTPYKLEKEKIDQLYKLQSKREFAIRINNKDMHDQMKDIISSMNYEKTI